MRNDEQMPIGRNRRASRWQLFNLGLRVAIPVGFAALTAVNITSLLQQGPARKPAPASPATPNTQVKLAAVGEIGGDEAGVRTVEDMTAQRPDLYLGLGDLGSKGIGSEPQRCSVVRGAIGPVAPFEIAAGESEADGSHDGRLDAYAECLGDRMNAVGQYGRQYYFDLGHIARVVVISPNLTIDGTTDTYASGDPEYGWLAGVIDSARAHRIEWVIVAMNQNCISAGPDSCNITQDLLSLLVNKHVDLVLSAHDHTYQRTQQLNAPRPGCPAVVINSFNPRCIENTARNGHFESGAGTIFAVVGSASNDLDPIDRSKPAAPYLASTMGQNDKPTSGYLLMTLTKASITARFVPTSPSKFADAFTIAAPTPPPNSTRGRVSSQGHAPQASAQ